MSGNFALSVDGDTPPSLYPCLPPCSRRCARRRWSAAQSRVSTLRPVNTIPSSHSSAAPGKSGIRGIEFWTLPLGLAHGSLSVIGTSIKPLSSSRRNCTPVVSDFTVISRYHAFVVIIIWCFSKHMGSVRFRDVVATDRSNPACPCRTRKHYWLIYFTAVLSYPLL